VHDELHGITDSKRKKLFYFKRYEYEYDMVFTVTLMQVFGEHLSLTKKNMNFKEYFQRV